MNKTYNFYYVYAYLREDGTPYYIGKGQRWRMNQKHNNVGMPPRDRRVKVKENLTEEEAHQYEIELIAKYGRKELDEGGILRNTSIGGEGFTKWRTLEERKQVKSKCDKKYRENPKRKNKILKQKKEYYEKNRENLCRKMREYRDTPEGKEKKAETDRRYQEEIVKKDPKKLKSQRRRKRDWDERKRRKNGILKKDEMSPPFKVVSPDGKVYVGQGYTKFSKEHGLHPSAFAAMIGGETNHHHGWTRYDFNSPEGYKWIGNRFDKVNKNTATQYQFKVRSPNGVIYEGHNQSKFAKEHGLSKRNLNALLKGNRKTSQGWTKVNGELNE